MVLGLLVLVTFIGGAALKMYSEEAKNTVGAQSGFRLQQLSRMGLESSFSMLRSMGATTSFVGSTVNVATGTDTKTYNITNCNYFPRTDDVKLPSNAIDSNLVSSGNVTCATARPNHSNLTPLQNARYSSATLTDSDIYLNTDLAPAAGVNYRSVFPWVRYRDSQSTMNGQYGADENIQTQINHCGLATQFTSSSSSSGAPLQRYRYEQDFDGLGESWLDLGNTSMNIYENGLTLEAWVWMDSANAGRIWQRIFDIGRTQQDGNIVVAYQGSTGQLAVELFNKGTCSDPSSSTAQRSCSGTTFRGLTDDAPPSGRVDVPANSGSIQDLWYYLAVTIDPQSVASPKVRVYTKCARTSSPTVDPSNSSCTSGTHVADENDWTGLYRRREAAISWNSTNDNYVHFRKTWVGKSHWLDDDFKGKMRDLRVWNRVLTASELNKPISVNYTANTTQSSVISDATRKESLRISPLYKFGNDRLIYFTVKETDAIYTNTWRLVSCAWNHKTTQRKTQSLRFRVLGTSKPEVIEYLPY